MCEKLSEYLSAPDCTHVPQLGLERVGYWLAHTKPDLETAPGIHALTKVIEPLYPAGDRDHGWPHIQAVVFHLNNLAHTKGSDVETYAALSLAALFHDVIRYDESSPAYASAVETERLLHLYVRPPILTKALDAIAQHSLGREKRYANRSVVDTFYDIDKADTSRFRWSQWGIIPQVVQPQLPIEQEYSIYLDLVLGTVGSTYTARIIQRLMLELAQLKLHTS